MSSDTKVGVCLGIIFVGTIILMGVGLSAVPKSFFNGPSSGENKKIEAFTLGQESKISGTMVILPGDTNG